MPLVLFRIGNIVAKPVPSALDHIFSSRDLFRRCLIVWLWSALSALLLMLLLFDAGLFVGMLADRGRLAIDLPQDQVARFHRLTDLGQPPRTDESAEKQAELGDQEKPPKAAPADGPPTTVHFSFQEQGILPAVWRSRDMWWGESLSWLYRNVQVLQSNILGAMTLLAVGALLWTGRAGCLSRLRAKAQQIALETVAPSRRNVHRQALRLGPEDLDGSGLVTASEIFSVEIENVRHSVAKWIEIDARFLPELCCLAILALSIQPMVSAQFLLFLGVAWYYLEAQERRAEAEFQLATDRADAELLRQANGFQTARLIRGLGIEQVDHDRFAAHLVKFHELAAKQFRAADQARHLRSRDIAACSAIVAFLLFILATHILLGQEELSIAAGIVFVAAWLLAMPGVKALRSRTAFLHSANVSAERIHKYLDQIPSVSQAVGARFLQPLGKTLHFDSVSYKSPSGRLLLNDMDLALEAGRIYSLVSLDALESAALVSMLPRFIEPQKGRILFDGEDIAWATLESLRAEAVFVGADEQLLPGTVLDNIRGGAEFTLQQATDAAKLTHAHNFIVKMFDGYESVLPDRSDLMDTSQRFRLALARAMVRNPALLIIEEPRVALDEDTKALLSDAYDRICRDRTVIFLPGRLSTVRRSDQVIVLNEGRVAAIGPQSKLVTMSPIYRHWEYLNFNEFRHLDS
jgi:ATP-binding cassette subfamily B protein